MNTLTESDLRSGFFVHGMREFIVGADTVVTGEAKIFAEKNGIVIKCTETAPVTAAERFPAFPKREKPEHMTNLNAAEMVPKNDPRIAFRGKLDTFQAQLLTVIAKCRKYNSPKLAAYLQEAVGLVRNVMIADVKNEPLPKWTFLSLTPAELREQSHHPEKYYNLRHQPPEADLSYAALELNQLRAQSRELEMAFSQAFIEGQAVKRPDIAELLNRLSSGLYILYCRAVQGEFDGRAAENACPKEDLAGAAKAPADVMRITIEVSGKHVHLTTEDVEKLFGPGHRLTPVRDLSQTGEFLSEERVMLRGPKGEMQKVAVLGPERAATQVELSLSDARALGVDAPLRLSGDLSNAADVTIITPLCELDAKGSAIIARNHIHLTPEDAKEMNLKDGQLVSVEVDGDRPVAFRDVIVRVKPSFRKFMHIDFDEANAAHIGKTAVGKIIPQ